MFLETDGTSVGRLNLPLELILFLPPLPFADSPSVPRDSQILSSKCQFSVPTRFVRPIKYPSICRKFVYNSQSSKAGRDRAQTGAQYWESAL